MTRKRSRRIAVVSLAAATIAWAFGAFGAVSAQAQDIFPSSTTTSTSETTQPDPSSTTTTTGIVPSSSTTGSTTTTEAATTTTVAETTTSTAPRRSTTTRPGSTTTTFVPPAGVPSTTAPPPPDSGPLDADTGLLPWFVAVSLLGFAGAVAIVTAQWIRTRPRPLGPSGEHIS